MQLTKKELIQITDKSLTLAERLSSESSFYEIKDNEALVNSRLEQWCKVVTQGDWKQFEKRLAWDGLNLSKVRRALGGIHISEDWQLPAWTETLNECLKVASLVGLESLENEKIKHNRFIDPQKPLPFEEVFLPFVYVARTKLEKQVGSLFNRLSESAHINLERNLIEYLVELCAWSMNLEFSVFCATKETRLLVDSLDNLNNVHSKQHYQDFIKSMLECKLLDFFREYPVLARLVITVIDFWVDGNAELLKRLESDWFEIQKIFQAGKELGQVLEIQPNLSDRHHNGRSVTAVTFASGLNLVYKPKNLKLEQAYIKLIDWLNKYGVPLPFKLFKVLDCSTYGWIEFVEALPCKNEDQVKRYYQRSGMLLCLVNILGGKDLHYKNIIASGEYPVLIDLETLMHPLAQEMNLDSTNKNESLKNDLFGHSVLDTGLLPRWQSRSSGFKYDASGFGGFRQRGGFFRVPKWRNINTDKMTLGSENITIECFNNIPSLNGENLLISNYLEEIIDGFRQMYEFLMKNHKKILDSNSPLTCFAEQSVRFIFRSTRVYKLALNSTLKPKFLQDGIERSIQLDIISRPMLVSDIKPHDWAIFHEEKKALEQLDIPVFAAFTNANYLLITPNIKVEKYFKYPSFFLVCKRLSSLNFQDLEKQISRIRDSIV